MTPGPFELAAGKFTIACFQREPGTVRLEHQAPDGTFAPVLGFTAADLPEKTADLAAGTYRFKLDGVFVSIAPVES